MPACNDKLTIAVDDLAVVVERDSDDQTVVRSPNNIVLGLAPAAVTVAVDPGAVVVLVCES